jgi:anti-sigma factor RsiW
MNHEAYQQHVSQFVDDELSESLEQELFLHLESCKECRAFLRTAWRMQSDIQRLRPQELRLSNASVTTTSSQRFVDRSAVSSPSLKKQMGLSVRTVALALLLVLLGCAMLSSSIRLNEAIEPPTVSTQANSVSDYR